MYELLTKIYYGQIELCNVIAKTDSSDKENKLFEKLQSELTKEQFLSILTKHGEDKILFATDSPWSDGAEDVKILRSFVDDERVLEKILYKIALGLLGL